MGQLEHVPSDVGELVCLGGGRGGRAVVAILSAAEWMHPRQAKVIEESLGGRAEWMCVVLVFFGGLLYLRGARGKNLLAETETGSGSATRQASDLG